jgi:ATP-binding cassette subfamily F protein 3
VIDEDQAIYYPLNYDEYINKESVSPVIVQTADNPTKGKKKVSKTNDTKELAKLEKKIAEKEQELALLREKRFDPDYYHDYQKMNQLDEEIDLVHNEIEGLLKNWEEYYQ